ncbi:hypothetical protein OF829_09625 [Sphingomonas sp. LB-2]|uniref:hypothetical protein n=1 Tax=Sphingomonas caeni TaxID=2984949 RepID=UPI0022310DCB|nr:hypothetical protein [Sphingomonas caeni]MCW3847502.1 hypothetical protein [Sphingomonas caeni]
MRFLRSGLAALALLLPLPALAQVTPGQDQGILVQGQRGDKPSNWRVAETDHVIVYSDGGEAELTRIAHNLERLHFLLSMLLNRYGKPDDTIKLRVTLVGDTAEFDAMDLHNVRSAQGPFAQAFQMQRYYDPREDGAVMAAGRYSMSAVIEPPQTVDIQGMNLDPPQQDPASGGFNSTFLGASSESRALTGGGNVVPISAEGRLYAGFAQHYLLTYFPAAYPRWYLDGFGELFATIRVTADGEIEYGRMPEGYWRVIDSFRAIAVKDIVTGRYLTEAVRGKWTPFHAWILTHYLFFSAERRPQFSRYLAAIGRGASLEEASSEFGDLDKLGAEVRAYDNKRLPYERMTYPPALADEPVVTRLTESQAAFLKGRIELGSRIEIPAGPPELRARAIAARDRWLGRLRQDARRYSSNLEAQLLLAEAECRSANNAECLAAAEAALRIMPTDARALGWKGVAQAQLAIAGPAGERPGRLRAARGTIVQANRADTESTLPLIGYFRSFSNAGEAPPEVALVGLLKAVDAVPAAPGPRLLLGEELARQGQGEAARRILEPVAHGPYDSPERARAQEILDSLPKR